MSIAPVNIVELTIIHLSSESWYLELPVDLGVETAALLAGASARMRLVGDKAEIALDGVVDPAGGKIILDSISAAPFAQPPGHYNGDVKVTLSSGRTIVPYVLRLSLKQGVA